MRIPEATRALMIHAKGDMRVQDRPTPTPNVDEALIQVAYGGICGSDLHYWKHGAAGASILKEPMVLGHEIVGTVVQSAADGSGPAVGAEVAVHPATEVSGDEPYPPDRAHLSPRGTYLGSAARFPHTQGGFADVVALPTRMLHQLPAGLSLRQAALAEPAAVAWHAVTRAPDLAGKKVVVIGAGPIGALIVAISRHFGAKQIVAVDLHEEPLRIAREVGATQTLRSPSEEELTKLYADVAFESSGSVPGMQNAIAAAGRGMDVVLVGLLPAGLSPVPVADVITRELRVSGSFRFNTEIDDVLAALAEGSLNIEPIVTHTYGIEDALEAFESAADASRSGKVLLEFTQSA